MKSICTYPCYRTQKKSSTKSNKKRQNIKLVFFDMDGVLLDTVSSWGFVHEYFRTTNRRSIIPYLRGDIDYLEFIKRDVSLWKTNGELVRLTTIKKVLYSIPMIKGAKECISYLKNHDIQCAIISAGLDILAKKVARDIGIDYTFANEIKVGRDGRLTGEGVLHVDLIHKDKNVKALAQQLHLTLGECAAVGNSCFDIPMLESCGLGIAFNPEDSCIIENADVIVEGKDLNNLIPVFQSYV